MYKYIVHTMPRIVITMLLISIQKFEIIIQQLTNQSVLFSIAVKNINFICFTRKPTYRHINELWKSVLQSIISTMIRIWIYRHTNQHFKSSERLEMLFIFDIHAAYYVILYTYTEVCRVIVRTCIQIIIV